MIDKPRSYPNSAKRVMLSVSEAYRASVIIGSVRSFTSFKMTISGFGIASCIGLKRRLIVLCFVGLVCAFTRPAHAHGGQDHTGESLTAGGGASFGEPIHVPKPTQFLLGIETARSVTATLPRRLKTLGRVATPTLRQAEVHSPFQGILLGSEKFVFPSPGDTVTKGDILTLVEQVIAAPETLSVITEIAKTESELQQGKEEVALATLEHRRVENLGDSVSGRRLAETKSALAVAQQKVKGLAKALDEMRQALSRHSNNPRVISIKAPIDGVVVASHVTPGEFVEPQKLLFELIDPRKVWVEADVYEADLRFVEDTGGAEITSEAYPDERFDGAVAFIGQRLDLQSRTIKTVFEVDNPEGRLREGMFVNIFIETQATETGTMFPKTAVVNVSGQKVVYVKAGPETFIARAVELLGTWGDKVMLSSGIEAGEIVVVQGMYQVRTSGL